MKYCKKCGAQLDDNANFCPICGENQNIVTPEIVAPTPMQTPSNTDKNRSTFYLIAFVLCIISTVSMGWAIIPLAWCIPMTVKIYRAYQNNESVSTGLSVCTLIFVNLIAGILLLVADSDK